MSPMDRLHLVFDTAFASYYSSECGEFARTKQLELLRERAERAAHATVAAWRKTVTGPSEVEEGKESESPYL